MLNKSKSKFIVILGQIIPAISIVPVFIGGIFAFAFIDAPGASKQFDSYLPFLVCCAYCIAIIYFIIISHKALAKQEYKKAIILTLILLLVGSAVLLILYLVLFDPHYLNALLNKSGN